MRSQFWKKLHNFENLVEKREILKRSSKKEDRGNQEVAYIPDRFWYRPSPSKFIKHLKTSISMIFRVTKMFYPHSELQKPPFFHNTFMIFPRYFNTTQNKQGKSNKKTPTVSFAQKFQMPFSMFSNKSSDMSHGP